MCFFRLVGFSLRLGHARVLTTHRVVIHYARAASLRRPLQCMVWNSVLLSRCCFALSFVFGSSRTSTPTVYDGNQHITVESKTQTYKPHFSWKFLSTFFKKWAGLRDKAPDGTFKGKALKLPKIQTKFA